MRSLTIVAAALCLASFPALAAPQGNKPPPPAPKSNGSQGQGQSGSQGQGAPAAAGQSQGQGQKAGGAKQAMGKPAPQMDQLAKLAGTWQCEGTQDASEMGPGGKVKGTAKITKVLGGNWYELRWEQPKSKEVPAMSMVAHMGWDSSSNQFIQFAVDSMGAWSNLTGPGWENDKLTWSGDTAMGGTKMRLTQTMTRKSDRQVEVTNESQSSGGQPWRLHMTCKK